MDALPDDMLRCIMARCGTRQLVCLGSCSRRMRRLAAERTTLPPVTLTAAQPPGALRWALLHHARVRRLVLRRCVYGPAQWLLRFDRLESLALAFCRVRANVVDVLPPTLRHLDLHQVLPPLPHTHARVCLRHLRALRTLRLVFGAKQWDAVFLAGLPRGLRVLHLRGSRVLIVESFMPRGLRDARLHAAHMLLLSNRLPNGVRRVRLACDHGRMWLREALPVDPRRLRDLEVKTPGTVLVPGLELMRRLRRVHVEATAVMANWRKLAQLPLLRCMAFHVRDWLGCVGMAWPEARAMPETMELRVRGVAVDLRALLRLRRLVDPLPHPFPVPDALAPPPGLPVVVDNGYGDTLGVEAPLLPALPPDDLGGQQ